jgi:hypothetical protein
MPASFNDHLKSSAVTHLSATLLVLPQNAWQRFFVCTTRAHACTHRHAHTQIDTLFRLLWTYLYACHFCCYLLTLWRRATHIWVIPHS